MSSDNTEFYEIVVKGFDGSTSDTDDKILWVSYSGEAKFADYVKSLNNDMIKGWSPLGQTLRVIERPDFAMPFHTEALDFVLPFQQDELIKALDHHRRVSVIFGLRLVL